MISQKERVKRKLITTGSVNNFWAIKNYILRLGAVIFDLRREGLKIKGKFGTGKNRKNYYYYIEKDEKK